MKPTDKEIIARYQLALEIICDLDFDQFYINAKQVARNALKLPVVTNTYRSENQNKPNEAET